MPSPFCKNSDFMYHLPDTVYTECLCLKTAVWSFKFHACNLLTRRNEQRCQSACVHTAKKLQNIADGFQEIYIVQMDIQ